MPVLNKRYPMKKHYLFPVFLALIGCFANEDHEYDSDSGFFSIDFEDVIKNRKEIPLSGIAEDISYVPLETNEGSLLGNISDFIYTKEYILVAAGSKNLYAFDHQGAFVRMIGNIGKGPGEYLLARQFSVDQENRLIYIQANYRNEILQYNYEGEYLKTFRFGTDLGNTYWNRDSLFISYVNPVKGNEKYLFTEIDIHGDTLQTINNQATWETPSRNVSVGYPMQYFYNLGGQLNFRDRYEDTVYGFDGYNNIIPRFSVNLGKHKLPNTMRNEAGYRGEVSDEYLFLNILESESYIFLIYCSHNDEGYDQKGSPYGGISLFNKEEMKGSTLTTKNGRMLRIENVGFKYTGFKNDFDGGPEFIPEYANDSLAFQFITAFDLKQHINSQEFINSKPDHADNKQVLLKQMENINENDNYILMMVKLK